MKPLILITVLLISTTTVFAQKKILSNTELGGRIAEVITQNYHPDSAAIQKLCKKSCVFIKFRVDKTGHIQDLSLSKDSASVVTSALVQAVNAISRDAQLLKALKKSGKTIVQPVIYDYEIGCRFPKFDSIAKADPRSFLVSYLKTYKSRDRIEDSMLNILSFSDGRMKAINCLWLQPIGFMLTENPY